MRICKICNKSFDNNKSFSNHIRWEHKEHPKFICKYCRKEIKMHLSFHEKHCKLNPKNIKKCVSCGKILIGEQIKFCSHSCSAKYNNQHRDYDPSKDKRTKIINCSICGEEIKVNFRASVKTKCKKCKKESNQKERTLICEICKKSFTYKSKNIKDRKTCSDNCYHKLMSKNAIANPNCGGDTNYKKFRYKGIYMDSKWEMDLAILFDDKKVNWIREPRKMTLFWTDLEGRKRRYHPDFFLPDYGLYIDTKNKYLLQKDDFKLKQVIKENHVDLLYGTLDAVVENLQQRNIL